MKPSISDEPHTADNGLKILFGPKTNKQTLPKIYPKINIAKKLHAKIKFLFDLISRACAIYQKTKQTKLEQNYK